MARKLLVIDDAPATVRLAETVSQKNLHDCDVLASGSGFDGLERARMIQPDFILLNDTLPDSDASTVLERMAEDGFLSKIPVILFAESNHAENYCARFANIARVLIKPISIEVLADALESICSRSTSPTVPPPANGILFKGNTGFISLRQTLAMAQGDGLTGVLRYTLGRHPIELWVSAGRFLFATTRNAHLYCSGSGAILPSTSLGAMMEAQVFQQTSGCPVFLHLSARGGLPHEDVVRIVREHGQRLFSHLITAGRLAFEFESKTDFPDFTRNFPPSNEDADNWFLRALRHVRLDQLPPLQQPDPNGAPAYTRRGYDLIQKLKINDAEARFATAINGTTSLQSIAQSLGMALGDALLIVHRFEAMEIIDFWNSGILSLPPQEG